MILVQIRSEIMSDSQASLDMNDADRPYGEQEARDAFNRMVKRYGWNKWLLCIYVYSICKRVYL